MQASLEYLLPPDPVCTRTALYRHSAGGVVAFDLRTRQQKFVQHLDLSSDSTTFKAYAYAAPTLADVNK